MGLSMASWNKKRELMVKYNETAESYNRLYKDEQTAKITTALKTIAIKNGSTVLDAGCGSGLLFPYLEQKTKFIVGVDLSKQLLFQAKESVAASRCYLINADVDHIPLKENLFDYVFSFTLLQNSPKPLISLDELKRVAKSASLFVLTGLKKKFTKQDFMVLLLKAKMKTIRLLNETTKCHIAICTK
jgi:ubiquinone/menaquinone biosynthesis C-methylase UbiE